MFKFNFIVLNSFVPRGERYNSWPYRINFNRAVSYFVRLGCIDAGLLSKARFSQALARYSTVGQLSVKKWLARYNTRHSPTLSLYTNQNMSFSYRALAGALTGSTIT